MNSNSQIFSSTLFGTNSGQTVEEINQKIFETQQEYLKQISIGNLRTRIPSVPSLQKKVKGK